MTRKLKLGWGTTNSDPKLMSLRDDDYGKVNARTGSYGDCHISWIRYGGETSTTLHKNNMVFKVKRRIGESEIMKHIDFPDEYPIEWDTIG